MNFRYSDLSVEQLYKLTAELKEKAHKAEMLGNLSELQINERKAQVALSYTMNPGDYSPGEIYTLKNEPRFKFKINYLNGVFVWGNRINLLNEVSKKEEGLPIALLGKKEKDSI